MYRAFDYSNKLEKKVIKEFKKTTRHLVLAEDNHLYHRDMDLGGFEEGWLEIINCDDVILGIKEECTDNDIDTILFPIKCEKYNFGF